MDQQDFDTILVFLFFGNAVMGIAAKNWSSAIGWSMATMCMLRIMFVH